MRVFTEIFYEATTSPVCHY